MNQEILIAFQYMLIQLAIRFVENLDVIDGSKDKGGLPIADKIRIFNERNDFSRYKMSLFPFLLTVANGKKADLLRFFEYKFIPISYGIVEYRSYNHLFAGGQPSLFDYKENRCVFKSGIELDQNNILDSIYRIFDFDDENQRQALQVELEKIDYSIKFIHEFRISEFANRSFDNLSYWSKNNGAYEEFFAEYKNANYTIKPDRHAAFISSILNNRNVLQPEPISIS